jgi:hypothetical protein
MEQVRDRLNAMFRGWQNYLFYGTVTRAYAALNVTFTIVFATSFVAVTRRPARARLASFLWSLSSDRWEFARWFGDVLCGHVPKSIRKARCGSSARPV